MSDLAPVKLHVEDDGSITSPYGAVGDLEPCVLMSEWIMEATKYGALPLCAAAQRLIGAGVGYTDGDVMTIEGRDRTLRYRLYRAEFDDAVRVTSPIYLGVAV